MEDFDLLYLIKTPFHLGNPAKALSEADELEIDESDDRTNELKDFFTLRILADLGDLKKLKTVMSGLFEKHKTMVTLTGSLIAYFETGGYDQDAYQTEVQNALNNRSSYPETQLIVLVYLAYLTKDYDKLFELTDKTKNLELLSVKWCGYVEIFRFDLLQQTVEQMKEIDDDNCLSGLWEAIHGFMTDKSVEDTREKVRELGEKNSYTIKLYTLLGLTMMKEWKFENALKIYDKALESLNILDDHTQYEKYVIKGNEDLSAFCVNYLKLHKILYLPDSEKTEKIVKILKVVSPNNPYWTEEEETSRLFDDAI